MSEIIYKNPITPVIKDSISKSTNRLYFAVPYISSFATTILSKTITQKILEKKLVTRFDDSSISTFDLPTLKSLLDIGFKIRFDNCIHLKLYITDNEAFITSSNLTKGGFEENIELTVMVDSKNTKSCMDVFDELWNNCHENNVTYELISANLCKYEILKKRERYNKKRDNNVIRNPRVIGEFLIQQIIDEIFKQKKDYSKDLNLILEANEIREKTKNKIKKGFDSKIFYLPEGNLNRKSNLFYDFAYGCEDRLAGAGLRESQYKEVFQHPDFEKVINYIYPEMLGMTPWNLYDENVIQEFCNGIFDFDIPQYSEVIPIRLASYFYPDLFLPIFKLEDLKKVSDALGLHTNAKTKGDRLYYYNKFIANKMKIIPFVNYIKMQICYQILYTVELFNRINNKEDYDIILDDYNEKWKKHYVEEGRRLLLKLKLIK